VHSRYVCVSHYCASRPDLRVEMLHVPAPKGLPVEC
jgi:hypothetical protein